MATRVALVSCVKTKRKSAAAAQDLYISPLFNGLRRYSELNSDFWYILSAEHGVLYPDQIVAPYERTLNAMPKCERLAWAERVQQQLLKVLPVGAQVIVLAGERYRQFVIPFLQHHGFSVDVPMKGLGFGPQLHWLKEQNG